jgi:hypothetical protein
MADMRIRDLLSNLKMAWAYMLEAPWRDTGTATDKFDHWAFWVLGWAWAIPGLLLGALVAPSLIHLVGLSNSGYQAGIDIGVSVVAGFLVQLVGWVAIWLPSFIVGGSVDWPDWIAYPIVVLLWVLPFVAVGYGLYRYFTWVGTGQARVTTAFVGALLIKVFVIPLLKVIVTGTALKLVIKWLRGEKK